MFTHSSSRSPALALAVGLLNCASLTAECGPLDDPLQLIEIQLEMDPADGELLRDDNTFDLERAAAFRACGDGPLEVRVRRKKARAFPSEEDPKKPSGKIDFDDAVANAVSFPVIRDPGSRSM